MSITVTIRDIPEYLKLSNFYLGLNLEDKYQTFKVPHCKRNLKIKNLQDLKKLLQTIDFWGLPKVYKFIIKNQTLDLRKCGYQWDMNTSALRGHLDCLKYLHENGCPWNHLTCASAAHIGMFTICTYI